MTNEDKVRLAKMLNDYDAKVRYAELKKDFPSGYMTKKQIAEYFGYYNNSRWATAFTKELTPYKDPYGKLKKYKITDVIVRIMTFEPYPKDDEDGENDI